MLKVVGALLVWCGCGSCGLRAAAQLRGRVRLLEEVVNALVILERELILNKAPLPDILKRMDCQTTGKMKGVFSECACDIERGNALTDSWQRVVLTLPVSDEERDLLGSLGQVLGRYDDRGQGEAVARIRRELEDCVKKRREQSRSLGRVYSTLGATAGGVLVLTLI